MKRDEKDEHADDEAVETEHEADASPEAGATEAGAEPTDELLDRLQRKTAELENYRKQVEKRLTDQRRWVRQEIFRDLLTFVDYFGAAMKEADSGKNAEGVLAGVKMLHEMLLKFLSDHRVHAFDSLGETFDPNLHDARSSEESDAVEPDRVVSELQRGYKMDDVVIRPAAVVVSATPAREEAPAEEAPAMKEDGGDEANRED